MPSGTRRPRHIGRRASGLAYPLARRFRTGMTLAMFAIIVLTLVYMGEMSYMFRGRADDDHEQPLGRLRRRAGLEPERIR